MLPQFTKPVTVADWQKRARNRLPRIVFDYLEGGAEDEKGLRRNREVFDYWALRPRRMADVATRSLGTTLLGKAMSMPLAVAPTGLNALFWPDGDLVLARAAERAGIPFILSTASNRSIEDVAASCDGDRWFQLYIVERQAAWDMIRRALETGYSTLVVTVDVAVNGLRERDIRNGFGMPLRYTPRILLDGALHPHWTLNLLRHGMPQLANFVTARSRDAHSQAALLKRQMDASFDWDALRQIRDLWPRRLLVKGLLNPQDASRAIALGADGVIVSNHGGRQLDSAPSPMTVLDAMVTAAKGAPVLVDSGFRRGTDVVKALAMGASAILIGRPLLYGMAAAGGGGVDAVIAILRDEVDRTLAQIGCPEIGLLSRDFIMPAAPI